MNTFISCFLLATSIACGALVSIPADKEIEAVHTDRSAYFETVGMNRSSVYTVAEVGRACAKICDEFLMELPVSFPQRITVLLDESIAQSTSAKAYTLSIAEGGFVTLRIFWNEELTLDALCHAMMEAFLLRYVHYKYGRQATSGMRAWVIAGLGQKCLVRYRPAETESLAVNLPELDRKIVAGTLGLSASEPCDRIVAYLLFVSFLELKLKRDERRELLEFALTGGSIESELNKRRPVVLNSDEALWWEVGIESFVHKHKGAIDSMEVSRQWLEGLANMEAFSKDTANASSKPNLRELGVHAVDTAILTEIKARQGVLLAGMLRVNPLYYNAAQSLGRYYEQILYGDPGFRRTATLIDYLNDLNAAQRMQALVERALMTPNQVSR